MKQIALLILAAGLAHNSCLHSFGLTIINPVPDTEKTKFLKSTIETRPINPTTDRLLAQSMITLHPDIFGNVPVEWLYHRTQVAQAKTDREEEPTLVVRFITRTALALPASYSPEATVRLVAYFLMNEPVGTTICLDEKNIDGETIRNLLASYGIRSRE